MPAGPIGSVWNADTWADTCWEDGSWGGAVAGLLSLYRRDLTAAVMDYIAYQRDAIPDDDSLWVLMGDSGIYEDARVAEANNDDINAALWLYLTF